LVLTQFRSFAKFPLSHFAHLSKHPFAKSQFEICSGRPLGGARSDFLSDQSPIAPTFRTTGFDVKAQIALCVLLLSCVRASGQDGSIPPAQDGSPISSTPQPFSTAAAPVPTPVAAEAAQQVGAQSPGAAGTMEVQTAPPVVVPPNGAPNGSQYPPPLVTQPGPAVPGPVPEPGLMPAPVVPGPVQPGFVPPPGAPYAGPPPAAPYAMPSPPLASGLIQPGPGQFSYPYSAQSPDVTMVPAPVAGALPDRYGWVQLYQVGELPSSDTRDNWGHFQEFTFDLDWKYTAPLYPAPLIFSFTQQFGYRSLDGVQSPSYLVDQQPVSLPKDLYHIGWDFQLQTAFAGPWNVVAAFNPSINSDFVANLDSLAWNWDARVAALYAPQRDLTVVLGVLFWDRVREQVLPWAGVIWRPTQGWQFDAVFPQIRVSTYLWDEWGFKTSFYGRVEYHSEAYQISNPDTDARDRVAFNDWRAMMGVNKDRGDLEYFFEGGWVFGRSIHFQYATEGGLYIDSGLILQAGVRF
jgi:hypothetical protein